ncbi:MAG: M3 family oligoendopeptidase [bacterium]
MNSNPPKEYPRRFVPENVDLGKWDQIEPLFQNLKDRELKSKADLEQWLVDQSELFACLSEERGRRYIRMTCHTDNAEYEKQYLDYIENIDPKCKPYEHALNKKYVECPLRREMDSERYQVLDRNIEAEIQLFREENIPLQTESQKLSQAYQKLCGAMTVEFDGQERTLPQMAKYLEETDRPRRQAAWEGIARRRLQDREKMDEIFDQLIAIRHRMALQADCTNFIEYAFQMYKRFDYSPRDCERFHQAVEAAVVPLARQILGRRRQLMKLDPLRPWDTAADPLGRPPLRPFQTGEELMAGVQKILLQVDPELAAVFQEMGRRGELDLESRKGKAPGGYQYTLDEIRRPFIFMNAAGLHRDVETLTHESGHAFHAVASRNEPLLPYRDSPIEFAEVASMSMELFCAEYYGEFYSEADAARAKRKHLEGIIEIIPWIARIDAFQHWLYSHPEHTREERGRYWLELDRRFGMPLDWTGYEETQESLWQRQLHLFCHPFYYIEYGIAQLGALQLWKNFKSGGKAAVERYRQALALGGSRPLPALFKAAGAEFDFSAEIITPLMNEVEKDLAVLAE